MALFAIWHDEAVRGDPATLHQHLLGASHVVPQRTVTRAYDTPTGRWHLVAFATATAFYSAEAQLSEDPAGGFCLWLDVSAHGGDEAATVKLYKEGGVRVIPGSYLARVQADGSNPGAGYIRVAMVQDSETTAEALHRLVQTLD